MLSKSVNIWIRGLAQFKKINQKILHYPHKEWIILSKVTNQDLLKIKNKNKWRTLKRMKWKYNLKISSHLKNRKKLSWKKAQELRKEKFRKRRLKPSNILISRNKNLKKKPQQLRWALKKKIIPNLSQKKKANL